MASPKLGRARDLKQVHVRDLYPFAGLLLAFLCVVAGVALFVLRAAGQVDWGGSFIAVTLHVNTAAPGVVCFIVAALVVYLTRPKFQ